MQKLLLFVLMLSLSTGLFAQGEVPVEKPKKETKQKRLYLKVSSNLDCELFIDEKKKGTLKAGEKNIKKIALAPGEHKIVAKSLDGLNELNQLLVMEKVDKLLNIELKEIREARLAKLEEARLAKESLKELADNMVLVSGGSFTMGCTAEQGDCEDDEKPTHQVPLSSYYIGKYELTQAQWRAVMGNNPSTFQGCDNCPVEMVSWDDVQEFIQKLNVKTGKQYRLQTEAEWEYAARGGNKSKGYKYSGSDSLNSVAWYDDNSGGKTHPVGQKSPNELGIYDMTGNVLEWCSDWYGAYSSDSQTNPQGASSGSRRVLRGGSWDDDAQDCRVTFRGYGSPASHNDGSGFRLVLVP